LAILGEAFLQGSSIGIYCLPTIISSRPLTHEYPKITKSATTITTTKNQPSLVQQTFSKLLLSSSIHPHRKSFKMPAAELVDYSPHQPEPASPLSTASNVILIDNFDSFSWNIYQYLVLEGATVTVYRNNELNVEELIALKPTQLVISPGPGHPKTDSGVSRDAIKYFAGKIPVFGVCMGQ
jgi:anthranilate synthase/indole-3-glycerol phosphate synthase/phosphoribosylanthranilate isomerase